MNDETKPESEGPTPPPPNPVEVARQVLAEDRERRITRAKAALDALLAAHEVVLVPGVVPSTGPDGSLVCSPVLTLELRS